MPHRVAIPPLFAMPAADELTGHFLPRRDRWHGKLVVKGVQCPDDAVRIKSMGADAIYVSNHGGRQLNAAPAAIDSLGQIRRAVGTEMPLIFDGGVRNGEHVVKALAMGADFVIISQRNVRAGAGEELGRPTF